MPNKRPSEEEFIAYSNTHTIKETAKYFNIGTTTVTTWNKLYGKTRKASIYKDLPEQLSDYQLQVVLGSLLGDGCLTKAGGNSNYRNSSFIENHSRKQGEYLDWKYDTLLPFSRKIWDFSTHGLRKLNNKIIADKTKKLHVRRMTTVVHPTFTELEKKWYKRDSEGKHIINANEWRIKIIPTDLILTPLMLAVWYMDDGSTGPIVRITCPCFSKGECDFLCEQIMKIGFKSKVYCSPKTGLPEYILIRRESSIDFLDMVKKYVSCNSVAYKCDTTYFQNIKSRRIYFNGNVVKGVFERNGQWLVITYLQGKNRMIGRFASYDVAAEVSQKIHNLRSTGVTDIEIYRDIARQYGYVRKYKTKNYWLNFDNIKKEISATFPDLITKGQFPSVTQLKKAGICKLNTHGTSAEIAKKMGCEPYKKTWTKYNWTEESILREYSKVIDANGGKYIGGDTLKKIGGNYLRHAVETHGGFKKWREILMSKEKTHDPKTILETSRVIEQDTPTDARTGNYH